MSDNKITDNRCRRYIRITDEESWRIIDEIATHDGYNSFNKIINVRCSTACLSFLIRLEAVW